MMKNLIFTLFCALSTLSVCAESEVYIFQSLQTNTDNTIYVDGKEACKLNGPKKKEQTFQSCVVPIVTNHNAYRKLVIPSDERLTLTLEMKYTLPMTGEVTTYKGEVSLDAEDGEVYYYEVVANTMNDMRLAPVEMKEVQKRLKNKKKWQELETITIEE